MIKLYDYLPSGNGYKVRLLLTQLALPFELIERDIVKGETRTPEFLAKFPNGRIPAVEFDDGKPPVRVECDHLLLRREHVVPAADPFERAQVLQWLFFEQYSHEPLHRESRAISCMSARKFPILAAPPRTNDDCRGYDALDVMEKHLASREWFARQQLFDRRHRALCIYARRR